MSTNAKFRDKVYEIMRQVPYGQVTTYGDIAGMAGHAYASRVVGGIAHAGPSDIPWHRLVNRFGGLASGFHGGRCTQQDLLEVEGVYCTNYIVDNFETLRWRPKI